MSLNQRVSYSRIGGLVVSVAHKYAIMMYSVLVKLAMFDTVVDDLRVNASAPQI